jgi:hypothetical protein
MHTLLQFAAGVIQNCDPNKSGSLNCQTTLPVIGATSDNVKVALQLIFGVIALLTVIYIIIAAIRYQISLGNPEATAKLRNTIIFAAVGLVITLAAEAIVTFTIGRV